MLHKLNRRSKQGLEQLSLWAEDNFVHSVHIRMWELTEEEREAFHDEVSLELMPDEPAHLLLGYGSAGTEHSLEGRTFLAQFASDERVGFNEGDDQTLRFFFKGKKPGLSSVVCTLEEA